MQFAVSRPVEGGTKTAFAVLLSHHESEILLSAITTQSERRREGGEEEEEEVAAAAVGTRWRRWRNLREKSLLLEQGVSTSVLR